MKLSVESLDGRKGWWRALVADSNVGKIALIDIKHPLRQEYHCSNGIIRYLDLKKKILHVHKKLRSQV